MDGVVQQDSVTRRADDPDAPACGVDEEAPEDLMVLALTREGHGAEARRPPSSPRHLSCLPFLATTRYP